MIKVLKLVTGEELIGRVECQTDIDITISSPRVMRMYQTEQGISAGLVPWLMTAPDAQVDIKSSHIMTSVDCPKDVEDSYLQQTSKLDLTSKIVV